MQYPLNKICSLGLIIFIIIPYFTLVLAQSIPQDFEYNSRADILLDAGILWNINSIYHPFRLPDDDNSPESRKKAICHGWMSDYLYRYANLRKELATDSLHSIRALIIPGMGSSIQYGPNRDYSNIAIQPFIWGEVDFFRHWYVCLYLRSTNIAESLPHYSGYSRQIARFGLNTAEFDRSLIGFRNCWVDINYGRSREIWGPSAENNLVLTHQSPAYERLMAQFSIRRFSFRYFFGFLESISDNESIPIENRNNIVRYIAGRSIEYNNRKNLVLGMGEVSIFSGPSRPIDLSYLNPVALHLEIEQNNRSNDNVSNRDNAIWFFNMDYRPMENCRISGMIILDEFQLDQKERNEGKPNVMGYFGRAAWTPLYTPLGLTLFLVGIRMDTYVLQHEYEYCNFVSHRMFLGHPIGNDADYIGVGVRAVSHWKTMVEIEYGKRRWGENSLLENPYANYMDNFKQGPFPSGEIRENRCFTIKIDSQPLPNFNLGCWGRIGLEHSGENSGLESWTLHAEYMLPLIFRI